MDDLLIAAPTADACFQATMTVLRRLAEAGFKVSKEKLQLVRPQVTFFRERGETAYGGDGGCS